MRHAPLKMTSMYVANTLVQIKYGIIQQSFKNCGIFNSLDGTDYLWLDD